MNCCSIQAHHYLTRIMKREKFFFIYTSKTSLGTSTNQNNGSSSSLKLYRFNGVLLQLSEKPARMKWNNQPKEEEKTLIALSLASQIACLNQSHDDYDQFHNLQFEFTYTQTLTGYTWSRFNVKYSNCSFSIAHLNKLSLAVLLRTIIGKKRRRTNE